MPTRVMTARFLSAVAIRACLATVIAVVLVACDAGPAATPAITPGTVGQPRIVVIVAKDYSYVPAVVDLVRGETVRLQIINGGLARHEAILGDQRVQDAWEVAEAPTESAPPGVVPEVSVAPDVAGLRITVASGQRVDTTWTVPLDAGLGGSAWFVGCHIPGHWAQGMVVPIRFAAPGISASPGASVVP